MKAQHTPGPWHYRPATQPGNIVDDELNVVAMIIEPNDVSPPTETEVANAQLIAAAPEMLAALRAAHNDLYIAPRTPLIGKIMSDLRAIITKAEGR